MPVSYINMQTITEIAMQESAGGVFTRPEVACWVGGSDERQFGLLKRAIGAGEILHVHRGLYCLADRYLPQKINPLVLAQRIYGPSYVSLETALSYHGWIPEAVYAVTSVSLDRSREYDTPLGRFGFARVPQRTFYAGVSRVKCPDGGSFLLASPLKTLTDYVYVHKCDWRSAQPIVQSLRVDPALLAELEPQAIDEMAGNYRSRRVLRFLAGLRKDLDR